MHGGDGSPQVFAVIERQEDLPAGNISGDGLDEEALPTRQNL